MNTEMKYWGGWLIVAAFIGVLIAPSAQAAIGDVQARTTILAGPAVTIQPAATMKAAQMAGKPSAAQIAASKAEVNRIAKVWAARTEGASSVIPTYVPPAPGTETAPAPGSNAAGPNASLMVLKNTIFNVGGTTSNISEPAIAISGKDIFATYNWGASHSSNGGLTWTDVNPYAGPWGVGHSFCCDQDVVHDPGRNLMLWYRQGLATAAGENQALLGASTDGGATWTFWVISSIQFAGAGQWFDYPRLALANNHLYWTTNVFNAAGAFQSMRLFKVSLDQLLAKGTINVRNWSSPTGWAWSPVEGAKDVMYVGDTTNATGTFTVCKQPQWSTAALTCVASTVPAWTFTNRNGTCITGNGTNPCLRADQRITGGYVARNQFQIEEIAFFWNVKEGAGFLKPYVNVVKVYANTLTPMPGNLGHPVIFNPGIAIQYASVAPNARGNIGGVVNVFTAAGTPGAWALIDDDRNGSPPAWEVWSLGSSAGGSSGNTWGDYNRARSLHPAGCGWGLATYTKSASMVSEERYYVIARPGDNSCVRHWWLK